MKRRTFIGFMGALLSAPAALIGALGKKRPDRGQRYAHQSTSRPPVAISLRVDGGDWGPWIIAGHLPVTVYELIKEGKRVDIRVRTQDAVARD